MTGLQMERMRQGRSRADVARAAGINCTTYGWIETRKYIPGDSQLAKIAAALDFDGPPADLLEEVDDAEH